MDEWTNGVTSPDSGVTRGEFSKILALVLKLDTNEYAEHKMSFRDVTESNKYYELGQKYLPNGSCGVISFGLKSGRTGAASMMDNLKMAAIVTHVADARTCVLHPASHTHRQMTDEQLKEAGVAPDLIRLSVGIEHVDDIIADLAQAIDKA